MNKTFKSILLVLLLFIPTYFAVARYIRAQSGTVVSAGSVDSMSIQNPNGEVFLYRSGDSAEADEEIAFMTSLNKKAKEESVLPEALDDASVFSVSYQTFSRTGEYKYYITSDPEEAYLMDPAGNIAKLSAGDAETFLCKEYAACLYAGSDSPVLSVYDVAVVPSSMSWRYQIYNGNYRDMETETTEEVRTYRMNSRFSLNFDVEPDVLNVTVYDGEEKICSGSASELKNIVVTEQKEFRFHIEAMWYELEGKSGQGEAVYDFLGIVNAPASFYIDRSTMEPGTFCVITVKDKPEDSDITFVSEPDIHYAPVFVEDGDYSRALVPIAYDLEAGTYTFTLSCDGVTDALSVNVTAKEFGSSDYTVSDTVLAKTRSEAALSSFDQIMAPVKSSLAVGADHMFSGTWSEGVPTGSILFCGFGRYRTVNESITYRHEGVDYLVTEGSDITAVNDGVVVYVGETDLSGKIVVIEHGLGLKSWYCHLNAASVSLGDTVKKGDVIGFSGSTGFCAEGTAHIALSVFGVFVCPYDLWENELVLQNP